MTLDIPYLLATCVRVITNTNAICCPDNQLDVKDEIDFHWNFIAVCWWHT